jgi:hypothetical protein
VAQPCALGAATDEPERCKTDKPAQPINARAGSRATHKDLVTATLSPVAAMARLVALLALMALCHPALALFDFGPIKPHRADGRIVDAEGFPTWYRWVAVFVRAVFEPTATLAVASACVARRPPAPRRDNSGQVCMPCLHLDPTGNGPCLSTRVGNCPWLDTYPTCLHAFVSMVGTADTVLLRD